MILATLALVASLAYLASASTVRLVGGSAPTEGRVEIYHNSEWGTVCDDDWGLNEAKVVCRQLGFADALNVKDKAYFGQGSGRTWLDNVNCVGTETTLENCSSRGWGNEDCGHHEDAGVTCIKNDTDPRIRLVAGSSPAEGRIEILHNDDWGTVCDDKWTFSNSRVVCRQLGYRDASRTQRFGDGRSRQEIWMDDVACKGTERSLGSCLFRGWGNEDCNHDEDVGVKCLTEDVLPPSAAIRLTLSPFSYAGTPEVFHEGRWGAICGGQNWNKVSARIFCRQLGYVDAVAALPNSYYGDGSRPSWMNGVRCSGTETRIEDCLFLGWHQSSCSAGQSAGVVCAPALESPNNETISSVPTKSTSTPSSTNSLFTTESVFTSGEAAETPSETPAATSSTTTESGTTSAALVSSKIEASKNGTDESMGYIIGIAVMGVLLATVIIILLIVFCCIYRRRSTKRKDIPQRDIPQRDSEMSVNPTYRSTGTASPSKSMFPAPLNGVYAEPGYHVLHHPNGQASGTPYANSSQTLGYDQLGKKAETSIPIAYDYPAPSVSAAEEAQYAVPNEL